MRYYEENMVGGDFKNLVVAYMLGNVKNNPYKDPDGFARNRDSQFYRDYEIFLNKQSNNDNSYIYQKDNPDCIRDSKSDIRLRTDQLGFSFAGKTACNSKYPYGLYLQLVQSENLPLNKLKEEIEFIAECINNTRTIGGAFVWPIVKQQRYLSLYNKYRGIGGYIEDRVDLTLREVKCFYQIYEKLSKKTYIFLKNKYYEEYEKNILFHYPPKRNEDREKENCIMFEFLKDFSTFENYTEFFCFEGNFVREGKIVDILNSDVSKDDIKFLEERKKIYTNKKEIRNISKSEDLRRILENVSLLVLMRSEMMEDKMKKGDEKGVS